MGLKRSKKVSTIWSLPVATADFVNIVWKSNPYNYIKQ